MRVSTQNLKETCNFLIARYKREIKDGLSAKQSFHSARHHLCGISILLIGFPEQLVVQKAIDALEEHYLSSQMVSAVAARPPVPRAAEIGQGGTHSSVEYFDDVEVIHHVTCFTVPTALTAALGGAK